MTKLEKIQELLNQVDVDEPIAKLENTKEVLSFLISTELVEGDPENIAKLYGAMFAMMSEYLDTAVQTCTRNFHLQLELENLAKGGEE